jgi:hypothetical protein
MANNFRQFESEWEEFLPADIEHNIVQQINTFSFFGKVVDLFIPNAIQTVVKMIGGDNPQPSDPGPNRYGDEPSWRTPPSKGPGQR